MINHVSIGVRDVVRSKRFYDAAFAPLGYVCLSQSPDALGYGGDGVALWIGAAEEPVPANAKSGLHF
jgi:catechol 2,3-dioxygenase-like lactoylglutathione lyase family enzyme